MNTIKGKTPWPTDKVMQQIYEKHLWGDNGTNFYSGEGSHDPKLVLPYLKAVGSFLQSFSKKPSICDLGCGDFAIGKQLVPFVSKYIGVDIVPNLIEYLQHHYTTFNVTFKSMNIAQEELSRADCAILRQVLQHLSNREIQHILDRLSSYSYLILTEHIPNTAFVANIDIISGQGIRLKKKSGVCIDAAPFHFTVKSSKELVSIPINNNQERIVTILYEL